MKIIVMKTKLKVAINESLAKITPKICGNTTIGKSIMVASGFVISRLERPKYLISRNRIMS